MSNQGNMFGLMSHRPNQVLSKCKSCKTEYMNSLNYQMHMKQHIDVKTNECKLCNSKFNSAYYARNHIVYTHTLNNRPINNLPASRHPLITNMSSLAAENKTVNSMLDQFSNVASNITQSLNPFASTSSQSSQLWPCRFPKCNTTFKQYNDLKHHIQIAHSYTNSFSCHQCNYKTDKKASIDIHYRFAHRYNVLVLDKKCSDCSSTFSEEQTLEKHMRIVHNKSLKEFTCNKCSIVIPFNSKDELNFHDLMRHPPGTEPAMTLTSNELSSEAKLIIQTQGHNLLYPKLKLYQCERCNAIVCNEIDLEEHDMEQHSQTNNSKNSINIL